MIGTKGQNEEIRRRGWIGKGQFEKRSKNGEMKTEDNSDSKIKCWAVEGELI